MAERGRTIESGHVLVYKLSVKPVLRNGEMAAILFHKMNSVAGSDSEYESSYLICLVV